MASTTSSYLIGVKADLDATSFQSGADQASAAMQGLATDTQTAATDIDTALTTDVPASVDSSAVQLTTKASKFKAVGTELGTNLAGGIGSGASGPEAVAGTVSSLSGLLASVASTPAGIVGAAGVGLGVAFVTQVIKGVNDSRQALIEQTNGIFEAVEVNAQSSLRQIRQDILDTFSLTDQLKTFGGGDVAAGIQRVKDLADDLPVTFNQIIDLIQHGVTPATHETYTTLVDAVDENSLLNQGFFHSSVLMNDTGKAASTLVKSVSDTNDAIDSGKSGLALMRGYYQDAAYHSNILANNTERTAEAAAAAASSAAAIASGIANAAASMAGSRWLYRFTH